MNHEVLSPAEWARQNFDPKIFICPKGDAKKARQAGFDLRLALKTYTNFICDEADIVLMLPNWEPSKGCRYEPALAVALEKDVGYFTFESAWNAQNIGRFEPSPPNYLNDALEGIQRRLRQIYRRTNRCKDQWQSAGANLHARFGRSSLCDLGIDHSPCALSRNTKRSCCVKECCGVRPHQLIHST